MSGLKQTFNRAYDNVMSKLGVDSFRIQLDNVYTPKEPGQARHLHVILSQTGLPISHAKMDFLPFPFSKFIIMDPKCSRSVHPGHSKEYDEQVDEKYTMHIVP